MDIELTADLLNHLTESYRRFEAVPLADELPQLDTEEKRNLAAFQIGMARQVPIPQEHAVRDFWYPPEMAAAYHLQHSTEKVQRLAEFVGLVVEATPIDQVHDVGSNAGVFAGFVGALTSVPIHCYEPIPHLGDYITANAPEADLYPVAVGAAEGEDITFFVNTQSLQTSSLHRDAIIEDTATVHEISVPLKRLDSIAAGRTIVKIDVQGAELQVLAGMSGCMAECQALLVESTYLSLETVTDIIPLARSAGFGWLYVVNDVSFGADVLLTRAPIDTCRTAAAISFPLAG